MKSSMIIHPDELSEAWIDKLAEAGIGTIGIHPVGGSSACAHLENLIKLMESEEYRRLIDYAHKRGLEVEYEIHAAGYLMPRKLFEGNPEYFRVDAEGQRTAHMNLCVSNPDALDIYATRAADLAVSLYGSNHNFYFWMDDGHNLHCNCPECGRLSPSDQQMLVLNRVAREIRKRIPDAMVAYLAYCDTVVPPEQVKAGEGIFLEYAPFEKYTAKGDNASELIERERHMIHSLMGYFEGRPKKVLEYWYDNSLYSHWKKPPAEFRLNEPTMRDDIKEYRRMGFEGISTFACFLGRDYNELYGEVDIKPFAECLK